MSLGVDPGMVMIRDQRVGKSGLLRLPGVPGDVVGKVLLAGDGIPDLHVSH
jgi:hypothetical protein